MMVNFLELDFEKYHGLVTDSTLKHTWKFLNDFGLVLETNHQTPQLLRKHDVSIMRAIMDKTSYSMDELKLINYCRIYLQVLTLTDITEGNGSRITTNAAEGIRDYSRISTWKWPNIPYPPARAWAQWRGAIKTTFLVQDSRYLQQPLGKWINEPHQDSRWFLDRYDEVLYEKKQDHYVAYPSFGRSLRNTSCHLTKGRRTTNVTNIKRTSVKIIKDCMIYSQGGAPGIHDEEETGDDDSTIQSNEHNDDSWSNPPGMELFVKPIHWEHIRNAITTNTCVAVTDGSYDPVSKLATACWIIEGRTSEDRAKGAAQTPGAHD